ncbi:MAG: DUF3426 domain-containing protein [Gammaproteobacteria bacterium]|nr:DUF3426 domain-containing protein [Gammaproteobacteria bacterium]MBU1979372.1 DUF3426 domain-containing protein [Gammaproteobacteria bacterium]
MVMVTTCPACHTRFKVTSEQMEAHGGDVRCGRCAKVFNAHVCLEHELVELQHEGQSRLQFEESGDQAVLPEEAAKQQPVEVEAEAEESPVMELAGPSFEEAPVEVEEALAPPLEAVDELLPESPAEVEGSIPEWNEAALYEMYAAAGFQLKESAVPAPGEFVTAEPDTVEPVTLAPQIVPEPVPESVPEQPVAQDTIVELEEEPKKRRFFWLWLIGILLLLASIGVQGVYFFRSDLAAHYPEFKPLLQQFCGVLKCSIRLPANPDLLSIETSNLEADPQQANLVALNAILRNRAKLAQEYPQFELTLTDTQDRMIARRIFTPREYAKSADFNRGIAPNEEVTLKLYLDLGDLKAAGYRVFLFYPQ